MSDKTKATLTLIWRQTPSLRYTTLAVMAAFTPVGIVAAYICNDYMAHKRQLQAVSVEAVVGAESDSNNINRSRF